MRALILQDGRVAVTEAPDPKPSPGEVLIRVHLAGICSTDLEIIRGYAGFQGILGHEFVGTVAEGPASLKGKRVVGEINCVCGRCEMCTRGLAAHCRRRTVLGIQGRSGAFAEYLTLPERNCHLVPDSISDEDAVFTEPLAAAFQVLHQVQIEPRTSVVVLGTGRLGLLVAQVFARTGCRLVAIGRNPRTLALLDRKRIRTASVGETPPEGKFDVVVDCTGSPEGLGICLRLVRPRGTIVMKTTCREAVRADLSQLVINEVALLGSRCGPFGEALDAMARRYIDVASLITHRTPLADAVEALSLAGMPEQIKVLLKVAAA